MIDKPGLNSTSFKIKMSENNFKPGNYIENNTYFIYDFWSKLKYYTGCYPKYKSIIVGDPENINGDWQYRIHLYSKTYRIFNINIYTKKFKNVKDTTNS